MSGFKDFYMF